METILFIIIAGILSSIFGKAKGKNKPTPSKSFKGKDFQDIRSMFENPSRNRPEKIENISAGLPVKQESSTRSIESVQQAMEIKPVIRTLPPSEEKLENEQFITDDLDEKTFINGIIWAEILGPPRSKRPYTDKR